MSAVKAMSISLCFSWRERANFVTTRKRLRSTVKGAQKRGEISQEERPKESLLPSMRELIRKEHSTGEHPVDARYAQHLAQCGPGP